MTLDPRPDRSVTVRTNRVGYAGQLSERLAVGYQLSDAHLNAPHLNATAGDTFKGVEIVFVGLQLNSEQTHFNVAERAEQQRLDGCSGYCVRFWIRANASHGMRAFPWRRDRNGLSVTNARAFRCQ